MYAFVVLKVVLVFVLGIDEMPRWWFECWRGGVVVGAFIRGGVGWVIAWRDEDYWTEDSRGRSRRMRFGITGKSSGRRPILKLLWAGMVQQQLLERLDGNNFGESPRQSELHTATSCSWKIRIKVPSDRGWD